MERRDSRHAGTMRTQEVVNTATKRSRTAISRACAPKGLPRRRRIGRDARLVEILEAATDLFISKGYAGTSVQELIDTLGIAKGTFYHYFSSKESLLDAVVRSFGDRIFEIMEKIAADASLGALEKLNRVFEDVGGFKAANRELMLRALEFYRISGNGELNARLSADSRGRACPILSRIIRQGLAEEVFDTPHPDQAGLLILTMAEGAREPILRGMANGTSEGFGEALKYICALECFVERCLGAPVGSIKMFDPKLLRVFFNSGTPRSTRDTDKELPS